MGNAVPFGGSLPCTCLHSRKVTPAVPGEYVHITGANGGHPSTSGAPSNGNTTISANNGNTKAAGGSSAPAYINNASIASPQLQTFARETFPMCLLLIGLDGAGKTSLLQWITQRYPVIGRRGRRTSGTRGKGGGGGGAGADPSTVDPKPTMGFSKEEVRFRKHPIVVHDLGGGKAIRGIWKNYYAEAHAIVLMVDSALAPGNEKWEELNDVIDGLIDSDDAGLQSRPLLVLLNKQVR